MKDFARDIDRRIQRFFEISSTFIFHPQFIAQRSIDLKVKGVSGSFATGSQILDVGSGCGPYWYLRPDCSWVGLDIYPSKPETIVVSQGSTWAFDNCSFDGVLCTQVLEHAFDFKLILSEVERILKPGGVLVISVPFIFPYHGAPEDFHRFSKFAMEKHLQDFQILMQSQVGNYFETMATLKNLFLEEKLNSRRFSRLLRIIGFPILLLIYSKNNLKALLLRRFDSHSILPTGIILVCKKPN